MVEVQSSAVHPDGFEEGAELGDFFFGIGISFQEMALSLQSAGNENPIDTTLERPKNIGVIKLSGAGKPDHLDIEGILQAHDSRQVGSGKGAIVAGEGDDIRLPVLGSLFGLFQTVEFFNFFLIFTHKFVAFGK